MAMTAADILIDTIMDWGVEVVFGLPGDGINGIIEALRKRQDKIRFIRVPQAKGNYCFMETLTLDNPDPVDPFFKAPFNV